MKGIPATHAQAAQTFSEFRLGAQIVSLCGDAVELLPTLDARGPFDLIFIDANKSGYVDYLNWAEKNVRAGGLIVGDNTFLWGALWDAAKRDNISAAQVLAMKEFNTRLADS